MLGSGLCLLRCVFAASVPFLWSRIRMWRPWAQRLCLRFARVKFPERAKKLSPQRSERQAEQLDARNQYIVMPGPRWKGGSRAHRLLETAADPVANNRAPGFFRHRKAEARRDVAAEARLVRARVNASRRLQCERLGMKPLSLCGAQKIRPSFQALRRCRGRKILQIRFACFMPAALPAVQAQADNFLRPRARRAAMTRRPPTVAIRALNPCRRLRTSLLG